MSLNVEDDTGVHIEEGRTLRDEVTFLDGSFASSVDVGKGSQDKDKVASFTLGGVALDASDKDKVEACQLPMQVHYLEEHVIIFSRNALGSFSFVLSYRHGRMELSHHHSVNLVMRDDFSTHHLQTCSLAHQNLFFPGA